MGRLSLLLAAAVVGGLAAIPACSGSSYTAPAQSGGGSGGSSGQDGGGVGGAAGGTDGGCDPKTEPQCIGVTCVNGTWMCGNADAGDGGCDPSLEPGCIGVACVNGAWVCGNVDAGDGGCDPKTEPQCIGATCVNGAWFCASSCEEGFCRAGVMSSCGTSDSIAVPSWSCELDAGTSGYCCMPSSTCGNTGYCTHDAFCHGGFVFTQTSCALGDGGTPGSCCVMQ